MLGTIGFTVHSLSAGRVPDKLARENIPVRFCREVQKNVLEVHIRAKDMKKAFAILRGSCYDISGVKYYGLARARQLLPRAAGLLLGALMFFSAVLFFQSRVLEVEVTGNGAYYEREVRAILREEGIREFSAMPKDTALVTARVLSLPRVEFCAFKRQGGVLSVEVRVSEDVQPIAGMPLVAPVSGTVVRLTVIRGTPLVQPGDEVVQGQTLVDAYLLAGEERIPSLVIASVALQREVSAEYALSRENALAQALLDFGPLENLHTEKTKHGWRIAGLMTKTASVNLA